MPRDSHRKSVWAVGAIAVIGAAALAAQGPQQFAGYVCDVRGSWRIEPQLAADLALGQGIEEDQTFRLYAPRPDALIRVALVNGQVIVRDCNADPLGCKKEAQVTIKGPDQNFIARATNIWKLLTAPRIPQLILTMSRGTVDGPEVEDAVLALHGGTPDLAPALSRFSAGDYEARLTPTTTAAATGVQLRIRWMPPRATVSGGGKLSKGLYQLRIQPGAGTARVLLAEPDEVPSLTVTFDNAKNLTAAWPPEMGERARHYFLASVLEGLYIAGAQKSDHGRR